MFTVQERDRVQEHLLEIAEADPRIVAAAVTGSHVAGESDDWSDVDLAFAIRGDHQALSELNAGRFAAPR